ncbi:hypothetical protein OG21DRAFT_1526989 [Imleria badia]|nr:hypothetical protein OG21DRAFT_1526989 [Imleria badia]
MNLLFTCLFLLAGLLCRGTGTRRGTETPRGSIAMDESFVRRISGHGVMHQGRQRGLRLLNMDDAGRGPTTIRHVAGEMIKSASNIIHYINIPWECGASVSLPERDAQVDGWSPAAVLASGN